jgi:glycosyltransferase involved in cell wall biosynthesis
MNKAFLDKFVLLDFFLSFYLLFIALSNRVKAVHFTTAHISNLFLSTLLKPFPIKQIFTIHDLSPHPDGKSKFIEMYNNVVIKFLADEVISFSKYEINKQLYKQKFYYFPLTGFEQKVNTPKSGQRTLLFFGRMEPYKGFNYLLNLVKLADKQSLDYKFILAGKGNIPNIDEFEKFENVEIINRFIDDSELYDLFNRASFSILPYDSATQSGVILLSYAYATPVIAYDVGALKEYIDEGKNGFCVKKGNNTKIIEFLISLTDQDILKLSQNTIEIFEEKYSTQNCKKLYSEYYETFL